MEAKLSEMQDLVNQADFYKGEPDEVKNMLTQLEDLTAEIDSAYTRWETLSELE